MSWELMEAMREHSAAAGQAKTVGVAVASYANSEAIAFPGNEELARWGFGERTIQRGLRKLEELGVLARRRDLESRLRPRVYEIRPAGGQLSLLEEAQRGVTQTPVSLTPVTQTGGGVCLAPAREGTPVNAINVNGTPLKPPQGGASQATSSDPDTATPRPAPRSATPARRRRERRRRTDRSAPCAPAECPLSGLAADDSAVADLTGSWRQFLERLSAHSYWWERWELWGPGAHPHAVGDRMEIGVETWQVGMLGRPQLLDTLSAAAGRPVALVVCPGAPAGLLGEAAR